MYPNFLTCLSHLKTLRKKKNMITNRDQNLEMKFEVNPHVLYSNGDPLGSPKQTKLSLRSDDLNIYLQNNSKGEMAGRFSDLIQRMPDSCEVRTPAFSELNSSFSDRAESGGVGGDEEEEEGKVMETVLMREVFEAVSAMRNAYGSLQEAHSQWDPEKWRADDVAVVGELRRLGRLRERYLLRKRCYGGDDMLREVVAPYEAAVEEPRREVKARDTEVEHLKEKLKSIFSFTNNGKKKIRSRRKVYCSQEAPAPELMFEGTMSQVREVSLNVTSLLLSLMRSAHWDIAAAVRSIEAASPTINTSSILQTQHANAKYALQSYISRKVFQGFDHESFYIDGCLSSIVNPDQYRSDCFTQYRNMKGMDPVKLLDILPACSFGKFCSNKYLAIVHPKMEESLFGDLELRQQVVQGSHPRSQFYGQFLELAKVVWLLHLLAFSLDPAPSQFEASRGAQFHPHYMESVVKFPGGRVPSGQVVGFPVSPGFKLGNGSIIKAGVYLASRN